MGKLGKTLGRLFRLWRLYGYMDFLWMTSDLKIFLVNYLSDIVVSMATISGTLLLAERFEGIGPWSKLQILFMLGYAMLVNGLLETLFGYNILFISRRVGRGQLDHILIQPQPIWMALLTDGFSPFAGSGMLLLGAGLLAWSLTQLSLSLSFVWLGTLLLNLLASAAIVIAVSYILGSLAFWAPRGAEEISTPIIHLFNQLKPFPLEGVAPGLLAGLMTVMPIGFVAWYPCRFLLGLERTPYAGILTPLAALGFAGLACWVFKKGLVHYGRTGSQRYRSLGHRG